MLKKIKTLALIFVALAMNSCDNGIGCGLDGDMGNGTFTSENEIASGRIIQLKDVLVEEIISEKKGQDKPPLINQKSLKEY